MNRLTSSLPIVAAPMAGATTVELAGAAAAAGAFPFLAAGYQPVESLADQIHRSRAWGVDFGVNLFVPGVEEPGEEVIAAYARTLGPDFRRLGVQMPPVRRGDDDQWPDKLDLLLADPVPVVSFTFALPPERVVRQLKEAGTTTIATVTNTEEARRAEEVGVDALVVQGPRAGGHSATWDPSRAIGQSFTAEVVGAVGQATRLPMVGAGGVAGAEDARQILAAGAEAVAIGTLLLRCPESGTSPVHRRSLADPRFDTTTVTRTFTGRPARALTNDFIRDHQGAQITAYPAVHHLTRPLRAAATKAGDAGRAHLWAGTGFRSAAELPAGQVISELAGGL